MISPLTKGLIHVAIWEFSQKIIDFLRRFNSEMESPVLESSPLLSAETPTPVRFINSESGEYSVDLPTFLIQRACANSALVNYFYWFVIWPPFSQFSCWISFFFCCC
jgi:hypothetical protein